MRVASFVCHRANRIKERSVFRNCQQNTHFKNVLAIPKKSTALRFASCGCHRANPDQEAMCFRNCQQTQIFNKCAQFLNKSSCVRVVSVGCHHANRIKERSLFRNRQQKTNLITTLAIPKKQASCELPRSVVIMRTVSRSDPF